MKKVISLLLALFLCLSLCGCGEKPSEDVAGTYLYVSRLADGHSIWLHPDYAYDSADFGRGTYIVDRNKIVLQHNNNSSDTTTLVKHGDFYCLELFEPLKDPYGRIVTFSKDGRVNHHISWIGNSLSGTTLRTHETELTFRDDGTFKLVEALYEDSEVEYYYEYEGTYTLEGDILTFTNDDIIFYLLYTEKGISRHVYKKYTIDEVKRELAGNWQAEVDEGESVAYTFNEDGTVIQHTSSGDFTYTYEIPEDGPIKCVSSDGSNIIVLDYDWLNGRFRVFVHEPWTRFVKE